ncbi:uncharacterized protein LY89DRAFT_773438 [Mollisia scopiformis]|uniref:Uncharacterized protein n=1 Tax=Mollisia scopiformis TaxID=149040 RepID=A0A194XGD3_MOLSC|nr:uncharacterized protein LY89DRAFT_773438 [Mollisia scopiformis]KUJ19255.1 hypothetical protein LY89DRAFT_773438 [Mollisia scopiformis]
MSQPLILTLRLDVASEKLLTSLRTRFFPSHRNYLSAHITLFHVLPAVHLPLYNTYLTDIASREHDFTIGLKSPFLLGKKGVAINIASFKLRNLHEEILNGLQKNDVELTEQDKTRLRPHVTVQNKVGEEEARKTMDVLSAEWVEKAGKAEGFSLWRYEIGGEWTFLRDFDFKRISS